MSRRWASRRADGGAGAVRTPLRSGTRPADVRFQWTSERLRGCGRSDRGGRTLRRRPGSGTSGRSGTSGITVPGAPVLLLGVLLLIAGVLAMHSLAGGHHRAASVDLTGNAAEPATTGHQHAWGSAHGSAVAASLSDVRPTELPATAQAVTATAAGSLAAVVAVVTVVAESPCGASGCQDHSAEVQSVCLAVLSGLALLLAAVGLVALRPRLLTASGPAPPAPSALVVRTPSLVQLCVSRT